MKNNLLFTAPLIVLFALTGYQSRQANRTPSANRSEKADSIVHPFTIKLSDSKSVENHLKLSDIASEVEYFPLETTDKSLIGKFVLQVDFTDDFIFFNTDMHLLQFDINGKYIRTINRTGHGPGECASRGFSIDRKNKLLYLMDNWNLSLYVFDFDGNFIKKIENPIQEDGEGGYCPGSVFCDKTGTVIYQIENTSGDAKFRYACMTSDEKVFHFEPNYTVYKPQYPTGRPPAVISPPCSSLYYYKDTLYYHYMHYDTVYIVDKNFVCHPYYIIHLPDNLSFIENIKACFHEIEYSSISGKSALMAVRETDKFIDIHYVINAYDHEKHKGVFSRFDKSSRQLLNNCDLLIKNDWDAGMDIEEMQHTGTSDGEYILELLYPYRMKELLTDEHFASTNALYPERKAAMQAMVDSLKEDDNPVIMRIKLK
jgi:hypothetical protein